MLSGSSLKAAYTGLRRDVERQLDARGSSQHIGTWMGRPGVSMDIRLQSSPMGLRVIVHKWDDEATCTVRLVKGDGRTPKFVEYWKVQGVAFDADSIVAAYRTAKEES